MRAWAWPIFTRSKITRSVFTGMLAVVLALAALATFAPATVAELRAARVRVDAVVREPLSQTTPVLGRFVARQSGAVAARSRGAVAEITVQVGDRVETGQILARLDTRASRARHAQAKAELTKARQDLKRFEKLRRSKSAAFQRARFDTAVQDVARAKANLRLAEIELNDADIRAPYPGVITVRHAEIGAYLNIGQTVVTMVNDKALDIEADVPAGRIAGLRPGREVRVDFANSESFSAVVRAIVPEENPMTRTRAVRLTPRYSNGTRGLAVNQSVTLHVPIGEVRDVVTVHKDAILHRGGKAVVFLVVDGTAKLRTVLLGEALGGRFEVREGLEPGDLVVVRGNERLRPGQKVLLGDGAS